MADTVKKSRIVSDDEENLEEALLEEFNIRLKSMSEDNLQHPINQGVVDNSVYENVRSDISPFSITVTSIQNFLENERLHHYDLPKIPIKVKESIVANDQNRTEMRNENIYETLCSKEIFQKTEPSDQYVDMSSPMPQTASVVDVTVSPITLDITIEKISPENCQISVTSKESDILDSSYEIVEPDELEKTNLYLGKKFADDSVKSVKDRMFLSTDNAAATLLFTQTVTSPMLTPSEENIDFLKVFQGKVNSDTTISNDTPQDSNEHTSELTTAAINGALKHISENLYENLNDRDKLSENIYENIKKAARTVETKEQVEDDEEHIYQDIEDCKKESIYEEVAEIRTVTTKMIPEEVMVENILYDTLDEIKLSHLKGTETDLGVTKAIDSGKIYESIKTSGEMGSDNYYSLLKTSQVIASSSENIIGLTPKIESTEKTENYLEKNLNNYEANQNCHINIHNELEIIRRHTENIETHSDITEETSGSVKTKKIDNSVTKLRNALEDETEGKDFKMRVNSNNSCESEVGSLNSNDKNRESYSEFIVYNKSDSNYYEKYTEVVLNSAKNSEICNREKDTGTVPAEIVKTLKCHFLKTSEDMAPSRKDVEDANNLTSIDIMKQINKFENNDSNQQKKSTVKESYTETTTFQSDLPGEKASKKKKTKKTRKEEKENISVNGDLGYGENVYNVNVKNLCRSFGDLTKIPNDGRSGDVKNYVRTKSLSEVLLTSYKSSVENVFSEVSVRALKEKFNIVENKNPLGIVKIPFKNCVMKSSFSKFDALQKKNVLPIKSSDSERTQEKFSEQNDTNNCKGCSKQVFQMELIKAEKAVWHKNCFRCTECNKQLTVEIYASHEGNLYCKPHFKSLFAPKVVEDIPSSDKPDLGLEELQKLNVKQRFQVFEHYQTETQDSNRDHINPVPKKSPSILSKLAKFHAKGMDVGVSDTDLNGILVDESSSEEDEDDDVPAGEDPTLYRAKKAQKEKPFHFTNLNEVKNKWEHGEQNSKDERREERKQEIQSIRNKLFMGKQGKMKEAYQQAVMQSESCVNVPKAEEKIESCDTKSLKERFEKGQLVTEKVMKVEDEDTEVYQSEISKKSRSLFLELDANASKPPQLSLVTAQKLDVKKAREIDSPEREIYHDPDVVRAEHFIDDSVIAKTTHTASKMLSKFRQMEEKLSKPEPVGLKPLKRFTPPPEPARKEETSEEESEEEDEEAEHQIDNQKLPEDLIEAQKTARAKNLRAKFEKWEAEEIKREQSQSVNIIEQCGEESQIESTKILRARFESMREINSDKLKTPKVKVNRFVEMSCYTEACQGCEGKVYPLEKITVHGYIFHKSCFKCKECSCVLRMDSYSYNQGLLYCTPHFKRLFISKGNYDTAFGLDKNKEKNGN